MSCPDWRALSRQRAQPLRRSADPDESSEWHTALRHFDLCPACQAAAPTFEPTLLFRRLPALKVGRDEVEAMKQAVAGMRRGQVIEHRRRPSLGPWRRAAALAAVLLGSLLLRGAGSMPDLAGPEARQGVAQTASLAEVRGRDVAPEGRSQHAAAASAASATAIPRVANEIDLWRMPLIETADPSYGSIIQVVDDDISVVLVVPPEVVLPQEVDV